MAGNAAQIPSSPAYLDARLAAAPREGRPDPSRPHSVLPSDHGTHSTTKSERSKRWPRRRWPADRSQIRAGSLCDPGVSLLPPFRPFTGATGPASLASRVDLAQRHPPSTSSGGLRLRLTRPTELSENQRCRPKGTGFPWAAFRIPKIAISVCYRAGMIGFVIFLAIGAGLLVGGARRLLRRSGRLAGGAAGRCGRSRRFPDNSRFDALNGNSNSRFGISKFSSRY